MSQGVWTRTNHIDGGRHSKGEQSCRYRNSWIEILPKLFKRIAECSYLIVDVGERMNDGTLWSNLSQTAIILPRASTYLQSCIVYNPQWNTRIRSFASVSLLWYHEERTGSLGHLRKPRSSRHSPSLRRDLWSSHSELVVLAPSNRIGVYEEIDQTNRISLPSFPQKVLATQN